jgi:LysR family glycine cleavage system transcriptional activator
MKRTLPPFSAVRAFEAAARHLKFKDAADELNVTQSAISHQVKALEDFLGMELFHRTSNGVTLTPAGEDYCANLTSILDSLSCLSFPTSSSTSRPP